MNIPSHIAIIMDGNRRWAKEKFLATALGHQQGAKTLKNIIKYCDKIGVKYLTVYAFSTENWKRTQEEVDCLMSLFVTTLRNDLKEMHKNNVKVRFLGDREVLSEELITTMEESESLTQNNTGVNFQIAFNYGARAEITNAVKNIIKAGVNIEDITEETISNYLYTKEIPDPDLLIRTGGDKRISNYLLWQIAYSEIYVTQTLWPDFDNKALDDAIEEFNNRQRRFGV